MLTLSGIEIVFGTLGICTMVFILLCACKRCKICNDEIE